MHVKLSEDQLTLTMILWNSRCVTRCSTFVLLTTSVFWRLRILWQALRPFTTRQVLFFTFRFIIFIKLEPLDLMLVSIRILLRLFVLYPAVWFNFTFWWWGGITAVMTETQNQSIKVEAIRRSYVFLLKLWPREYLLIWICLGLTYCILLWSRHFKDKILNTHFSIQPTH